MIQKNKMITGFNQTLNIIFPQLNLHFVPLEFEGPVSNLNKGKLHDSAVEVSLVKNMHPFKRGLEASFV